VSVFFEIGDSDSDFLKKIGFDPKDHPEIAEELSSLGKN